MEDQQHAFHIEEFRSLKEELKFDQQVTYQALTFSTSANAAIIYFWLTKAESLSRTSGADIGVVVISLLIAIFGFLIYALRQNSIRQTVNYLQVLEKQLSAEGLGFEAHYQANYERRPLFAKTPFVMGALFLLQFITSISFGIYVTWGYWIK